MISTRRQLLKHAAVAGSAAIFTPSLSLARSRSGEILYTSLDDPDLRQLIQTSVETATAAGASYADVRISHVRTRRDAGFSGFSEQEWITAGVRALVNGYWGFASGPVWDKNELIRLAKEAVQLARISAQGKTKTVQFSRLPEIARGHWATPVEIDPFQLHPSYIRDAFNGLRTYAQTKPFFYSFVWLWSSTVKDQSFGSSDGAFFSQTTQQTRINIRYTIRNGSGQESSDYVLNVTAGAGYELLDEAKARAEIDRINAEGFSTLQVFPIDVGRYDVIYSPEVVAQFLGSTIGCATELDRALGYEANASGTSYLNDPDEMAGSYKLGSPALTVTANRNEHQGLSTVRWDDEGVASSPFTIVDKGVLQTYQSNRELAQGTSNTASMGCLYAPEAINAPLIRTPNLNMAPGPDDTDIDALVASIEKGILFKSMSVSPDFQQLNGIGFAPEGCFEIQKGRIFSRFMSAGVLFRAPELWKSIIKIGGPRSVQRHAFESTKGEPQQKANTTITCPAIVCKDQTVIDYQRKA